MAYPTKGSTVKNPFRRSAPEGPYAPNDAGTGDFRQYAYDLLPTNSRVTMQLAGSDPAQEALAPLLGVPDLGAFISRRTIEEERTDAPVPVRFLTDGRMSPIVGYVPAGLEPVVFEALWRIESRSPSARIPAEVFSTRHGIRVKLLMGLTR